MTNYFLYIYFDQLSINSTFRHAHCSCFCMEQTEVWKSG